MVQTWRRKVIVTVEQAKALPKSFFPMGQKPSAPRRRAVSAASKAWVKNYYGWRNRTGKKSSPLRQVRTESHRIAAEIQNDCEKSTQTPWDMGLSKTEADPGQCRTSIPCLPTTLGRPQ